ncbi:MAG: tRNA (adenosine(37)-N6)-threonylcarbamoyltransferase complex ATPase subunit type 1 TsaE [Verrucomicrobiales bacterium]|nr:tRNA (adenosine(37)-N6)-threonylcarbamoyltransferase complex ATPase subunit type 1 TsaE [Verrucomicrobiales bacterium]
MPVVISRSVEETEQFGERLGMAARRGQVYGLSGDLGAGKTALVRGFARGLGCPGRVHSPTFALVHEYGGGREPLFHLDLYRLAGPAEIEGAGLDEYMIRPGGVSLVEWIERWESPDEAAHGPVRRIRLRVLDENTREMSYDDSRP